MLAPDNNGVLVLAGGLDVVKTVTYLKGSKIKLCLVLLQVPKCFGLVRIFCARTKIYLQIVAVTNILCYKKKMICIQ